MNFDEAFKHYQEGTASEEEKAYVKEQLALANEFLADDDAKLSPAPCKEAEDDDVKKAKKTFKWKYIIVPVCTIVAVLLVVAAILGGVFGFAASSAKDSAGYKKYECIEIARDKAFEFLQDATMPMATRIESADELVLDDVDLEFNYNGRHLENSYYSYFVEFVFYNVDIELEVDTRTGYCKVVDVDY